MAIRKRRNFAGPLRARVAADGTWRINGTAASGPQIIVIGADPHRAQACGATLHDLALEWRGRGVLLMAKPQARTEEFEARSAIVHEPLPHLYASLPLADFDVRAQRFWRRVFLLVRLPGGRRLLGMLARLSRNKP